AASPRLPSHPVSLLPHSIFASTSCLPPCRAPFPAPPFGLPSLLPSSSLPSPFPPSLKLYPAVSRLPSSTVSRLPSFSASTAVFASQILYQNQKQKLVLQILCQKLRLLRVDCVVGFELGIIVVVSLGLERIWSVRVVIFLTKVAFTTAGVSFHEVVDEL
ncbi:hypothetical protein ACLOJK_012341, partial [Asimina triloba]